MQKIARPVVQALARAAGETRSLASGVVLGVGLSTALAGAPAWADASPLVRTFEADEYRGGYQIFGVAQDHRGILYFADPTSGVLEYDGERWRTIETPAPFLALAVGAGDRLWVGSNHDIGVYEGDESGEWQYTSLRPLLPEGKDQFTDVWPIVAWGDEVFFVAREYLYRYANGRMTTWDGDPERIFYRAYETDGRRFFAQDGVGLNELVGDELLPLRAFSQLANAEINAFFGLGQGRFLVLTRRRGVYIWDGGGEPSSLIPYQGGDVAWLQEAQVQHATRLDDQRLVIGTVIGGVGIFDEDLRLLQSIDSSTGLADNLVHFVEIDRDGDLWAGTGGGVSHIRLDPGLSFFGPASGLEGTVRELLHHHGQLTIGTTMGLYRLKTGADESGRPPSDRLERIPGFDQPVWSILAADEKTLIISDADGITRLRESSAGTVSLWQSQRIFDRRTYEVFRSPVLPGELLAAGDNGLERLIEIDGQWRSLGRLPTIDRAIEAVVDGPDRSSLAISFTGENLYVIQSPPTDGTLGGIPRVISRTLEQPSYLFEIGGAPYLVSETGVDRIVGLDAAGSPRLEHDEELSELLAGETGRWWLVAEDDSERLWLISDSEREIGFAERRDGELKSRVVARELPQITRLATNPRVDEAAWVGTFEGLLSIDASAPRRPAQSFRAQVRRVETGGGRVLYGGNGTFVGPAVIEPGDRDLRIEFAAPSFDMRSGHLYRHRLDGFDDDWSPWRERADREYTNLPAGSYTFRVEAQDAWGEVSAEDRFVLRVLPPWYWTSWAITGWACLGLLLVAAVVRVRSAALRRHNRVLRMRVEERTVSLAEQTARSEEQAVRLQRANELLEEENRHRRVLEEEKNRLLSRSERSHRLESLGMMAGGIAHDFNNILMAVLGNADLCLLNNQLDADTRLRLGAISQAAQRAADLCGQMLSFAGKDTLDELQSVDCNAIARETLGLARASVPPRVRFESSFEEDLPRARGDEVKLHQVFLNLLLNAAEAYGADGGVVSIETSLFHHRGGDLPNMVLAETLRPGSYIRCVVSDQGPGIAPEIERRIFEPFFTTKFAGRGLGLAASLGIVRAHRGALRLETQPGQGTRFEVLLPPAGTDAARDETQENLLRPLIEGQVLVVDDEPLVREVAGLMLRTLGSEPIEAETAGAALAAFETHASIDLAILDLSLPDLDGLELSRRLRQKAPGLPIVLASGWSSQEVHERGGHEAIDAFLHKPYTIDSLSGALQRALEAVAARDSADG